VHDRYIPNIMLAQVFIIATGAWLGCVESARQLRGLYVKLMDQLRGLYVKLMDQLRGLYVKLMDLVALPVCYVLHGSVLPESS
jgi:hypothetical protein